MLAGDIIAGPYCTNPQDLLLTLSPDILIYDTIELGYISYFAAYRQGGAKPAAASQAHPFDHQLCEAPFLEANYSSASLQGVVRARTFLRRDGHCCAIILDYINGSQRAMGDCRVGIDPVETWNMPKYLCILKTTYTPPVSVSALQTVKVRFSEREHQHAGSCWTCHAMGGNIEFWFTHNETSIRVL